MRDIEISIVQDLCYMLGVYFGDGSVQRRTERSKAFVLQVNDKEFRDAVLLAAVETFNGADIYKGKHPRPGKRDIYHLRVGRVGAFIEELCKKRQRIPKFVFSSRALKHAFLSGIMDSDGWVTYISYVNRNEAYISVGFSTTNEIADKIKALFTSLGIETGKTGRKRIKSGKISQQWFPKIKSLIKSDFRFRMHRKQKALDIYARFISGGLTRKKCIQMLKTHYLRTHVLPR
jgi:intein/homing endonuclease